MFVLINNGETFSFNSWTKLLKVVSKLHLNRKSASQDRPTHLTGRICTGESRPDSSCVFLPKKEAFPVITIYLGPYTLV